MLIMNNLFFKFRESFFGKFFGGIENIVLRVFLQLSQKNGVLS